jgi:putative nucleotidyltransferase with HDIG domain
MSGTWRFEMDKLRRNPYLQAIEAVAASGSAGPLYLVGGYLRDFLLGRSGTRSIDLDLVIWGQPELFGRHLVTAMRGRLIRLEPETVRVIAQVTGVLIQIDISRPKGTTIEDDLTSRDFTVNALAVRLDLPDPQTDPQAGKVAVTIIDPAGGLNDLKRKRLRVITPSAFSRDPLRLIRAVRLAGELNLTIEEATRRTILEKAALLDTVSGERLRDELFKILDIVPAVPWIECLDALQLLQVLIPEVEALKSVPASKPHRLPLWEHSIQTLRSVERLLATLGQLFPEDAPWLCEQLDRKLEAGVTTAAILKLLGLLHDIGKPKTRSIQPDGRVRFLGHEQAGIPILSQLCERLRLGRRTTSCIIDIERHHLRSIHLFSREAVTAKAQYRFFRELGDIAPIVLLHSWADLQATIGGEAEEFSRYQQRLYEAFRFYRTEFLTSQVTPIVRGDDLIKVFGMTPGPFLGFALDRLQEAQATGLINCREEALAYIREHLTSWQQSFEIRPSLW